MKRKFKQFHQYQQNDQPHLITSNRHKKKPTLIIHAMSWWDRHNTVEWLNRFKYDQVKNIYSRNIVES